MTPPRIPTALLRALLPTAERNEVLGDLAAEFAGARRAKRRAARSSMVLAPSRWLDAFTDAPHVVSRADTGFEPNANAMQPGGPALEQWIMDARHAVRRLVRRPRYATLAILTLALGIGGTAAVFGIVTRDLLRSAPVRAPRIHRALLESVRLVAA